MQPFTVTPIGVLRTPHTSREGMPIQPTGASACRGEARINPELADGLKDLEGFSHLILLYHFHESSGYDLTLTPFLDTCKRGLFATRSPRRPCGIGLSVVRLTAVHGNVLELEGVDMLDNSPLVDIKPYVPRFDTPQGDIRCGWLENTAEQAQEMKSDDRFVQRDSTR
ncbi:tRNA (N6-threonylcarbamoyladenosine(37)-N6)-methyltransferase TrmO [Oleidesulfovibrio alaskensis]|jgi:tRNA-Thr(GGU) m(6)t(6)A37 methyltransferase TsaA|uniref:tRNA (N6-threonylcarbamoyladenosine(37)-N6)-methyltransferase TrmO n=1 Tax=Oleidesulfovibrio alaskensis TaxID=58180 RepID=UPI00041B5989|nr:tRNA (N6-threonylcarbamoyladenosine(37)-N6)-methyltransferase TrmO [Oleidesulfovibrio alaskensis]MBL3582157.1 tRNA (N6-threonylcarbamoyladenosine(37)-N6)-methyltransferase TrmO [Oleidesulfovibrio alaskensis]